MGGCCAPEPLEEEEEEELDEEEELEPESEPLSLLDDDEDDEDDSLFFFFFFCRTGEQAAQRSVWDGRPGVERVLSGRSERDLVSVTVCFALVGFLHCRHLLAQLGQLFVALPVVVSRRARWDLCTLELGQRQMRRCRSRAAVVGMGGREGGEGRRRATHLVSFSRCSARISPSVRGGWSSGSANDCRT